jgi:hypothetical protein
MSDPHKIAARVGRALGDEALVDKLVALPLSDLTSLLLEVSRRRSAARTPADLLAQYERAPALRPARDDARATLHNDLLGYAAAAGFEPLALSPVAPQGVNAVLGGVDQNSTLAALRGLEVLADPTTVLALECARRRRAGAAEVRLCSAARMLRMQPLASPSHSAHFAILGMVTAGRDRGGLEFALGALAEQLRAHLGFLARAAAAGYRVAGVRVEIADTAGDARRLALVEERLFPALQPDFPGVTFALDPARTHAMTYYRGLCLHVTARAPDGETYQIGDGGFVDWTQRLLSNAKERLLVSGYGVDMLERCFR